jgi:prolyl-tRNA synthetase
MRQSQLFTKTRKEPTKDEVSRNADLLIRGGFIHKEMAGVYDYLPLGLRVFNKISTIIREEMDAIGGQELLMTTLQEPEKWKKTGRWDETVIDVWFRTLLATGSELGLGNTHEEPITDLMRSFISSYRDLPVYAYQLQTKFRNELRAKSGIMRAREFVMKDLYSFSRSQEELDAFYEQCAQAYENIFNRCGIGDVVYKTFASGGAFSKFSHEFQAVCDAGEDIIYIDEQKRIAINREVFNEETMRELGLQKENIVEKKAIEVGNIFKLGTRFSEALELTYTAEDGSKKPVVMGCYGIGPGRLMGTVVEILCDEKGIVWPESIAPFRAHLIRLGKSESGMKAADGIYEQLKKAGVEVLYDDRDAAAGEKFADYELLGIPYRLVVSEKTGDHIEVKKRTAQNTDTQLLSMDEVLNLLKKG